MNTINPTSDLASLHPLSLFSLANRTIIVTGGASGLGLTLVRAILESGADVVALDASSPQEPGWTQAQDAARSVGAQLGFAQVDVTDADATGSVVEQAFEQARSGKPVRGLFHAAGIQLVRSATDYALGEFRRVIDVNLTGSFVVAAAFARAFFARNPQTQAQEPLHAGVPHAASIVLVASMSARVANFGIECTAYNASKAGVAQLARNLAMEWGQRGIRVNSLSPGYIRTAMTAVMLDANPQYEPTWSAGSLLGRLSTADEFRGPTIFLLSDASSFMTGSDLVVDGGHTAV